MKMKKRMLMAMAVAGSVVVLPTVAVQARRGVDDPAGHVRQEDRQADRRVGTPTVAPTTTEGVVLSDTSSSSTTPTSTSTTTQTGSVLGATTLEQAVAIAKKQFPAKTVEKVEKEFEHSTNVWSVRFTDNSRVDVSAETGEVVRIKDKTNNSRSSRDDDDSNDNSGSDDSNDDKDGNSDKSNDD